MRALALGLTLPIALSCACSSSTNSPPSSTPDEPSDAAAATDAKTATDAAQGSAGEASAGDVSVDGSNESEAGGLSPDRFVTAVVSFSPTECTGFGASAMPGIVEGPPVGGGSSRGSTDVVSLGSGGSIVVSFDPNAIVDGPGVDFIVFENPFWVGGNSSDIYAEPGEVSVSNDGVTWATFPCTPTVDPGSPLGTGVAPPYGQCAGWHVVYSAPGNGISPVDPATAGGDAFDLADVGLSSARYVRIVDKTQETCPEAGEKPDNNGFDLDAVSIVNAKTP